MIPSLLAAAAILTAAPTDPQPISPEMARPFVSAGRLVEVAPGRRLNLVCMGDGPPTVLFDAGGSDWSVVWARVLPLVAGRARACAYDRAGLGHSDAAAGPRAPVAIVEDLHALIGAAGLGPRVVLVGHSLGGFNVKLHAALYPDDVAGLVLVDPSEERDWDRTRTMIHARFGAQLAQRTELMDQAFLTRLTEHYRTCEAAARPDGLDPESETYRRCTDPVRPVLGPDIAAERRRVQATAAYQTAQASEIANSIYGSSRSDPVYARIFVPGALGAKPLIVLTHGTHDPDDPSDALGFAQWQALHRETAQLSSRGVQRTIPDTSHHIELEAPETVASAVIEVIAALARPGT